MHKFNIGFMLVWVLCPLTLHAAGITKGTSTQLEVSRVNVPRLPRHEQGIGQTRIILRDSNTNSVLLDALYEGNWFCLGFKPTSRTYLVGGIYERGAWLPLASIQYLSEITSALKPSAFDRLHYLATASVASPDFHYVVLIGGQMTTGDVFVLNTDKDTIKALGPAPAPPPRTNALDRQICAGEPFEWGSCWADGYEQLDPGIIRFPSENAVIISYGKDTALKRAKHRRTHRYKLD